MAGGKVWSQAKRLTWFRQTPDRLVIHSLPKRCPNHIADMAVLRLDFAALPRQVLGYLCVDL